MAKKKIKLDRGNIVIIVFIVACFFAFVYSSVNIISWYVSNKKNDEIKEELQEFIIVDEKAEEKKDKYKIDFGALKERNDETVGYLKVNNMNIDYVVVQGEDNDYYLRHNFDKEWNSAGWVFADFRNNIAEDTNIIIYGHDMRDGSMFGDLQNILNKEWHENEENLDIVFATEKGAFIYRIASAYVIDREEAFMPTSFKNNHEYQKFIDKILARSINEFDTGITVDDKMLTLSTCASNSTNRIIVHAKLLSSRKG